LEDSADDDDAFVADENRLDASAISLVDPSGRFRTAAGKLSAAVVEARLPDLVALVVERIDFEGKTNDKDIFGESPLVFNITVFAEA
jgi:hypothetical protein